MGKNKNQFREEEMDMLLNEFIIIADKITKDNLHIEILKYLRQKQIKISNPEDFNQFYELIEKRYL